MTTDVGRSPTGPGYSPKGETASASSAEPSIPNAAQELRKNAEALRSWMQSMFEQQREAVDPLFGRGYGVEAQLADLFAITTRIASSVHHIADTTASAIEAATAASTEGESAVPQGDAQGEVP